MGVQIWRQVQQVRVRRQLSVENSIMMASNVVWNMAVQDVGQYQGRGSVACICQPC